MLLCPSNMASYGFIWLLWPWSIDSPKPSHHKNTAVLDWCDWMTWWERWGWINTTNHPNNKGKKNTRVHQLFKMKVLCGNTLQILQQLSKSVLDNRCMKLLEVVSTLKRVWPSSSMAQLQIDASDTPGEIRGKFHVFIYWLFGKEILFQYLMNFLERMIPDEKWSF